MPARVMLMTKHEQTRAACTNALARLGLDAPTAAGAASDIPEEACATLCYALAAHLAELGGEAPGADLDAVADGVILQQAVLTMHNSGEPNEPVGDEWNTRVVLARIVGIYQEAPHRFPGPDRGRRSLGDVCAAMLGVIRGGRVETIAQWIELTGIEVVGLPRRFDGYVLAVAGQMVVDPHPIAAPAPDDEHDPEIADIRQAPAWDGIFRVENAQEGRRFVDLVIGEKQRQWLAHYLARTGEAGQQANVDHVNACLLTNKLFAAWLIWRTPELLRRGGDVGLLAELVRDAYQKLAGGHQTELFGTVKDVFQASWLGDLLSR